MPLTRREFVTIAGVSVATVSHPDLVATAEEQGMYGLIGKIKAVSGERDTLISILLEGMVSMPGCLSYIVAKDPTDADVIWVTEAWDSQASHKASLTLESVQQAIAKGRPLIAGFDERFETVPIGGHGLAAQST